MTVQAKQIELIFQNDKIKRYLVSTEYGTREFEVYCNDWRTLQQKGYKLHETEESVALRILGHKVARYIATCRKQNRV